MLSFELSVMDIVLGIAIIILLLLIMTRTNTKDTEEPELSLRTWKEESLRMTKKGETSEEPERSIVPPEASEKKESVFAHSPEGSSKCSHYFGYLKTLPLGSTVPQECHTCPRSVQCLAIHEQNIARA